MKKSDSAAPSSNWHALKKVCTERLSHEAIFAERTNHRHSRAHQQNRANFREKTYIQTIRRRGENAQRALALSEVLLAVQQMGESIHRFLAGMSTQSQLLGRAQLLQK
jgi:hypothetical protein